METTVKASKIKGIRQTWVPTIKNPVSKHMCVGGWGGTCHDFNKTSIIRFDCSCNFLFVWGKIVSGEKDHREFLCFIGCWNSEVWQPKKNQSRYYGHRGAIARNGHLMVADTCFSQKSTSTYQAVRCSSCSPTWSCLHGRLPETIPFSAGRTLCGTGCWRIVKTEAPF